MHHTLAVKTRLETKKYKVKSRLTGFLLKACLLVCVAVSWQKSPIGLPEKGAYLIHELSSLTPSYLSRVQPKLFTLEIGCQHMNYVWRTNIHSTNISATFMDRTAGIKK